MAEDDVIERLAELAALTPDVLPEKARRMARLSLADWATVALAGADEPLANILRDYVLSEGGRAQASVVGAGTKVPARAAALANGSISHALDYDDTHFAHVGHLSVGVLPAALAVGEEVGAKAADVVDAFLVGAEAAIRVGVMLGRAHYEKGFHQTSTAGAFGATVAAGRLYGLSGEQLRHALSLVATRASGLKSQFGTMGKPFNAGVSASNGVEAAALASRGFRSCDDGLTGPQGFSETHEAAVPDLSAWDAPPPGTFLFEANTYKLHACCHGTHAMIEALLGARRTGHDLGRADAIEVVVTPRWLRVCDVKAPRTGLEIKFSYVWLAAMVASGISTSDSASYTDARASDSDLAALASRVDVSGDDGVADTATTVRLRQADGGVAEFHHDLLDPVPVDALERRLRAKTEGLLGRNETAAIWDLVDSLDRHSAADIGRLVAGADSARFARTA